MVGNVQMACFRWLNIFSSGGKNPEAFVSSVSVGGSEHGCDLFGGRVLESETRQPL